MYDIDLGATGAIEITNLPNDFALRVAHRDANHLIPEHTVWWHLYLGSWNRQVGTNKSLACQSALHFTETSEETWGAWGHLEQREDALGTFNAEARARDKALLWKVGQYLEAKGAIKTANAAHLRNAQVRRRLSRFRGRSSLRCDLRQPSTGCALPWQCCRCVR